MQRIASQVSDGHRVVRVGVQMVVVRQGGVLFGCRMGAFQAGNWGLPGGHLELGESFLEAAVRELREETGLLAQELRVFCVTDPTPESNHHMQIGVEVLRSEGTPRVVEPSRCSNWRFFPLDALPSPLFVSSTMVMTNYVDGTFHRGIELA